MTDLVWLLDILQRVRLDTKDRGAHVLLRLFMGGREPDVVPLADSGLRDPLLGLSHIPARFVVYVHHVVDGPDRCFRAIALHQDGPSETFTGGPSGPITPDADGSSWQDSRLGLYLQRIAWGKPLPWPKYSPESWVVSASLRDVVDAIERGDLIDEDRSVWPANAILQRGVAEHIAVLRRAENPSRTIPVEGADDWYTIGQFGPFLGAVEWDDLDAEILGAQLGYSADIARWWTARGIGHLAQVDVPSWKSSQEWLDAVAPRIASNMWSWVGVVQNSVTPHYVSPVERGRQRWKDDDPVALLQAVRDIHSARAGAEGTVVVGYRRSETGRLSTLDPVDTGRMPDRVGSEFIAVPDLVGADGVLLIDSHADSWGAVAMNRDGEQGYASSDWPKDDQQFLAEATAPDVLAALRRILTGHARFDSVCTPFELARRRVLYGIARVLERANVGADAERAKAILDLGFLGELTKHVVPLLPVKGGLKTDAPIWDTFASVVRLIHGYSSWEDVRLEPLAEAWAVPLDEARWWGQEGLAGREAQYIPDETESMIRCATAVGGYAAAAEVFEHIRLRAQQLFGEDLPVRWGLVPQPGNLSVPDGTLSA